MIVCQLPLFFWKKSEPPPALTLVTQPMLQLRPNCTELRSMDSYIQILCRFQKCKRKVPPPSPLSTQKSPFTTPKEDFSHPLGGKRVIFHFLGATVEELFDYIFGIYKRFGYKDPSILATSNSVSVAT